MAGEKGTGDMEVSDIREVLRVQIMTNPCRILDFILLKGKNVGGFECRTDIL